MRNVEKYRKSTIGYNVDKPPTWIPSDLLTTVLNSKSATGENGGDSTQLGETAREVDVAIDPNDPEGGGEDAIEGFQSAESPTCPHYRNLSARSTALLAHSAFVPNAKTVNCCSFGGEKSTMGVHDIEDLVSFSMKPHVLRNVAIYRTSGDASFGISLTKGVWQGKDLALVAAIAKGQAAEKEGTIRSGDAIIQVNGTDVIGMQLKLVAGMIRNAADVLILDVSRGEIPEDDGNEYSAHSPCPYYLSQALADKAELIFAPYNYILDPGIRSVMGIDLTDR